jgi:hypothetical protein
MQAREQAYVTKAARATRRLRGCGALGATQAFGGRFPTVAPDSELRSELAALNKPAVSANSLPRSIVGWGHRKEYGRFIRLAATIDDLAFYIIPTASPFGRPAVWRCVTTMVAKVHAEALRIPASIRPQTLALAAHEAANDRLLLDRETGEGVCLVYSGQASGGTGGACGATAADIRNWGLVEGFGRMVGLVPDGVATVTVRLPASGKRPLMPTNTYRPASTSTFSVHDNVFATNIVDVEDIRHASVTWQSANGHIIKTVPAQVDGVDTAAAAS